VHRGILLALPAPAHAFGVQGRERARVSGLAAKKREIVAILCKLSIGAI
jgi:hypothetical protein